MTRSAAHVRDENKTMMAGKNANAGTTTAFSKGHPVTRAQLKRTALEDVSNVQAASQVGLHDDADEREY